MARVIIAPNEYPQDSYKIYLAGAIDMGDAEDWQQRVVAIFINRDDVILLNPRRREFKPEMEEEQIQWELEAMEEAQCILMWFPKDAKAPISFLELGLYIRSRKLFVGVEEGFYRQCNIELAAQRYNKPVYHSLEELVNQITNKIR